MKVGAGRGIPTWSVPGRWLEVHFRFDWEINSKVLKRKKLLNWNFLEFFNLVILKKLQDKRPFLIEIRNELENGFAFRQRVFLVFFIKENN
jgi:hypothetical protein